MAPCVDCDEVLQAIELYIDGEVDAERSVVLAEHLGHCSPCMQRAEFRARLKEILRRKCRCDAPEHLVLRIRATLRAESDRLA